jgi:hypothetical protein
MTNFQLLLSIGVPSLVIVIGFMYNNSRLNTFEASVNARFNSIESNVSGGFQDLRNRLTAIEADLRQFYRDLGRHEADIATLKEQRRA